MFVSLTSTLKNITCLSEVRNKKKPEKVSAIIYHLLHAVSTSERDEDQDLVIEEIGESSDEKSDSRQITFERSECLNFCS